MNLDNHGVVAIIKKDGRYLLLRDARKPMKNFWGPPHGRCKEADVDERNSVKREVLEETNLIVRPMEKLWTAPADTKVNTVSFWLVEIVKDDEIRLNEESYEFGWFTLEEALKLKLYPGTEKFFKLIKEKKI